MIKRGLYRRILSRLFKGKVVVLYGARRVGKTTLSQSFVQNIEGARYFNCELEQNRSAIETTNTELLKSFFGPYRLIILDEAQHIQNIGLILKVLVDTFPDMQIIATGSSSFDLGQKISEPLTGRARRFVLYPLSYQELVSAGDPISVYAQLDNILRFGLYPEVYGKSEEEAIEELNEIASNYLYKDVLQFERLKRSDLLMNLLKAFAFQLGSDVSFQELSRLLGVSVHTVIRYIELLEQSFVIYRLHSYSRNPRKELSKSQKIYFNDLGIRNAVIQQFAPLNLRNDKGALWENFCINERIKWNQAQGNHQNIYFWRSYAQQEVDYIEESDGQLHAFEFKYAPKSKVKVPSGFAKSYPDTAFKQINRENFVYELFR